MESQLRGAEAQWELLADTAAHMEAEALQGSAADLGRAIDIRAKEEAAARGYAQQKAELDAAAAAEWEAEEEKVASVIR